VTDAVQVDIFDSRTRQWSATRLQQPRMWLAAAGIHDTVLFAGGVLSRERGVTVYSDTVEFVSAAQSQVS
jgi:hypothetical protein